MLPQKFDTTIAHKMINLMPELSGTDKGVAGAILDHFNRKTGQCDPGIERIAWLVGVDRRTVIRSVSHIVQTGIFRKERHGGYSQRNSYEPVWSRFRELEADWRLRFNAKSGVAGPTMSPAMCQTCHLPGGKPVTQTFLTNQSNRTRTGEPTSPTFQRSGDPIGRKGQPSKEVIDTNRAVDSSAGGTTNRCSIKAAHIAAERRWNRALYYQYVATPKIYGEIVEAIDPTIQAAATEAELRRPGAGLLCILSLLQRNNKSSALDADIAGPKRNPDHE